MYGSLDISTSGMIAQRTRLDVIAANLANQNTLRNGAGSIEPYRRRVVTFAPGDPTAATPETRKLGVHVQDVLLDPAPLQPGRYDPDHPDAYKTGPFAGYLAQTNVHPIIEHINELDAQRAYQANVMAAEATKQMIGMALRLLA